eukprot:EG_transcript_48229
MLRMLLEDLGGVPHCPPPPGFSLRLYREGDAAMWAALQQAVEGEERDEAQFWEQFGPSPTALADRLLFAVDDSTGGVVGCVAAWHLPDDAGARGRWGLLHSLAVLPAHRGAGLGRALL